MPPPQRSFLTPFVIAASYALASALWIAFSDSLVGMFTSDSHTLTHLQTLKGMVFVLASAAILFWLVRHSQSRLLRSESRYRTLFGTAPIAQLLVSADTHIIQDANRAACLLYECGRDELIGSPLDSLLITPEAALTRSITAGRHRHRTRGGQKLDVSLESTPLLLDTGKSLLLHIRDITKLIDEERRRLQAEHNFREALSGNLFILYRHNLLTDAFDYISPAIEHFTGVPLDALTAPGGASHLRDCFHTDDLSRAYQDNLQACTDARGPSANADSEVRLRRADGTYRWMHNAKTLMLDPDGRITHVVGAAVDVTEGHTIREHLTVTLRSIADAVITTDARGRITLMNPVAEQLTGWQEAEGKDYPLARILSIDPPLPDDEDLPISGLRTRLQQRNGKGIQVSCSRAPIRTDGEQGSSGNVLVIHDLTAELEARARLDAEERRFRETQARYALAMQGTNEGLWDWNPITLDLLLSSRLLTILGMEEEHLQTNSDEWLARIHPDDVAHFQQTLVRHLHQQTPHFECEYRVRTEQGDYRWVLARGLALFNPDGCAYRMVGSVGDITDRKRAEQQLRELNADLEHRVAERTLQLQTTLRELESFSYSVSHDLRAPLRAIDGYSAILRHDHGEQLDDEASKLLDRMRAAVQRMGTLIDDLLDLSRVTRQPLNRQTVKLSDVAHHILDELRLRDPQRCVACDVQDGLQCSADPNLITLVLQNLLDNAWKFTARTADAHIRIGQEVLPDGQKRFFIEDNGAGFDMRYRDKLFTPFQRLHADRDFQGTGIGLATVARIIHRHGGEVEAESQPGERTVFRFTLG